MKTIWKFELKTADSQTIEMPFDADILCVQLQNGIPYLWVLVDSSKGKESRVIDIFGTGHSIDNHKRKYIGTFQSGDLFHVFEYIG